MTRLFGTDGIRGVANEEPLTPELAFRVGRQLVATLQVDHGVDHARIVIGRDTRRSGPRLEAAAVSRAPPPASPPPPPPAAGARPWGPPCSPAPPPPPPIPIRSPARPRGAGPSGG